MGLKVWLAGLTLFALTQPAYAAFLRPTGSLIASVVKLSDLFDDLDAGLDRAIGPAPAPGGRIIVEAAQLSAIARQFGVDWRPASPADRVVLDRPGRALGRDEVLPALRLALDNVGAPLDADIELPGFAPPLISVDGRAEIMIEQLEFDSTHGRFGATIAISGPGISNQKFRVSGSIMEMVEIPVLVHRLQPGSIVRADDLKPIRLRASLLSTEVARTPDQAIGLAVRRTLGRGQPIALADLGKPLMVTKNNRVSVQLQSGALVISATGQAMESGALGDRITVLNPNSRAIIEAEVIGAGRVRVLADSAPVVQAGTRVTNAVLSASTVLR